MKKLIFILVSLTFSHSNIFSQEICDNGMDDDADSLIDCFDPDCSGQGKCISHPDSFFYGQVDSNFCQPAVFDTNFTVKLLWRSIRQYWSMITVVAGDLDGDGIPEVLHFESSTTSLLIVLDGATGAQKMALPFNQAPLNISSAVIADGDLDGFGEIYISSYNPNTQSEFTCYEHTGALKWVKVYRTGFTGASISIADFDGDNVPELYNGRGIILNSLTGDSILAGNVGFNAYGIAADVLPDSYCPDCDGLEFVTPKIVYSVDLITRAMTPRSTITGFSANRLGVADFNGDGMLDVICNSSTGGVTVWDPRTVLVIDQSLPMQAWSKPLIADIDNDGELEVVIVSTNDIKAFDHDLSLMWQMPTQDLSSYETTPVGFDFDGDGIMEIVYRDEQFLHIFNGTDGKYKAKIPCVTPTAVEEQIILDVNNDGQANIICTCEQGTPPPGLGGVLALGSGTVNGLYLSGTDCCNPWMPARKVWNQEDYFVANINDDLTIPAHQQNSSIKGLNSYRVQTPMIDISGDRIYKWPDMSVQISNVNYRNCQDTADVEITFCNQGNRATIDNCLKLSFYNNNPLTGGVLLFSDSISLSLPAGSCRTTDHTIPFTDSLDLYVYANDNGISPLSAPNRSFNECDLGNNLDSLRLKSTSLGVQISNNTIICEGKNVNISASGAINYSWSNGATTNNINVTPTVTTTYTLIASGNISSCADTISTSVTVNPQLVVQITSGSIICAGNITNISATGAANYLWSNGSTTNNINVIPAVTTSYTLIASDNAFACADTLSSSITVNPSPVIILSGNTSVCMGTTVIVTATGGGTYLWNTGATTSVISVSPTSNTTYTLTVTESNSCKKDTSVSIIINSLVVDAGSDTTICAGENALLVASGAASFIWSNGASNSSITVSPAITTTYTVIAFNGNCTDSDTVRVFVDTNPTAYAGNDVTIVSGSSTILSASGAGTYQWDPPTDLSCINCPNPVANPKNTTTYYLTVTNGGCISTDSVIITVELNCKELFIPTAFSPNDDGQNDVFKIEGNCIKTIILIIYNRWGEKVFSAEGGPASGWETLTWDGTYKNKPLDTGVFAYQLRAILITSETIIQKGNISLIK